jgi:hypothetical protein
MSEPRIGRVLVASLHQAIAEVLPDRLEFYENWLNPTGLRQGTIGLAPLAAVLSFLRQEGEAYGIATCRAGEYAADWTVLAMPALSRAVLLVMPPWVRARYALHLARNMVRGTYPGSRAISRVRRGAGTLDIRGSIFCEVRQTADQPLCGFYAAATDRLCYLLQVPGRASISRCRATGGAGCLVAVELKGK